MTRWPLHLRLALAMSLVMATLALALLAVVHAGNGRAAQETTQRMNLGLAAYIGQHLPAPLLDDRGRVQQPVVQLLASHVMAINPAVEVYLLGPDGQVRAHALGVPPDDDPLGRRVNLGAVRALLAPDAPPAALPVLGDDPRRPGQRVPVSVARLPAPDAGYLYVVLQGQAQRSVAAQLAPSLAGRELAAAFALVALGAAVLAFVLLHALTRPLRRLASQVQGIRTDGAAGHAAANEVALLEAAVAALTRRVDAQFQQLQQADQRRRDLVSGLSHDLRTPLAGLRGQLESLLIDDASGEPDRKARLQAALRQSERLRRLIDQLFELARLDDPQMQPHCETFCLAELLQDVVQGLQPVARARGVALTLAADSHGQAPVWADLGLVERLLQNLLDNALRCTPPGGQVSLGLKAEGTRQRVSVADTGGGIAPEDLPRIFDPHWRGSGPQAGSAGLGLAIVRRIVALHGGQVAVQSHPGQGTCFTFDLAAQA